MYLLFLGNVHFKFEIKRYNRNLVSRYVHFKYQNVHLKIALYKSVVKMYIFKPQTCPLPAGVSASPPPAGVSAARRGVRHTVV